MEKFKNDYADFINKDKEANDILLDTDKILRNIGLSLDMKNKDDK